MIKIRRSEDRGHAQHGWLEAYHSFSFANFHDPANMGFRALRVINEDRVQPGQGFGEHGHRDMEIVTYVLAGALEHKDSMGNGSVMRPGDVQRMSAGTGVTHSEFNHSDRELVHLLQIWILPERTGSEPGYEQRHFDLDAAGDRLTLIASRDGRDGSVTVHQDAAIHAARLSAGATVTHPLAPGRHAWLQIARGALEVGGQALRAGDGAAFAGETELTLRATDATELLLFDLA